MSTRALYTFKGDTLAESWNVYKHHDGCPSGAADVLLATLKHAWPLPRYEADEFAAAFCVAAKISGGGVRFMPQGDPLKVASANCSDIEYRYEVAMVESTFRVRAYAVNAWDKPEERLLIDCPMSEFQDKADAL